MTLPVLPSGYTVRFADGGHQRIRNWQEMKDRCGDAVLGLYLGKVLVGTGELHRMSNQHGRQNVHTDAMQLRKAFRRKGHGIHLYVGMILAAKSIGADAIFSSRWLNKFSKRMWNEKLAVFFKVTKSGGCSKCHINERYCIKLKETKC